MRGRSGLGACYSCGCGHKCDDLFSLNSNLHALFSQKNATVLAADVGVVALHYYNVWPQCGDGCVPYYSGGHGRGRGGRGALVTSDPEGVTFCHQIIPTGFTYICFKNAT